MKKLFLVRKRAPTAVGRIQMRAVDYCELLTLAETAAAKHIVDARHFARIGQEGLSDVCCELAIEALQRRIMYRTSANILAKLLETRERGSYF